METKKTNIYLFLTDKFEHLIEINHFLEKDKMSYYKKIQV